MTHVDFRVGLHNYRLTSQMLSTRVLWPALPAPAAVNVLRGAIGGPLPITATQIRTAFPGIDGGRAAMPAVRSAALADRVGALIQQKRMMLFDLGPQVTLVRSLHGVAVDALPAGTPMHEKVRLVIAGLADVPLSEVGAAGEAAFIEFKKQMTESPALVIMMVIVFAGWVASHGTVVGGLVIDAALLGIAIYSLGMLAFDWFERLAALVGDISNARTRADTRRCSSQLAKLIVEIGIATFLTLLLRAAGRRVSRTPAKPAPDLKTAPPKSARPTPRQSELDARAQVGPQARSQVSYKGGQEVKYGTPGSTRPDWVADNISTEVKNYKITGNSSNLTSNIVQQAKTRAAQLPPGMQQNIIIDTRGQIITPAQKVGLVKDIVTKSGGIVKPNNIFIKE